MARPKITIDFDSLELTNTEPCRDERCPVIGLHPNHKVIGRKGRSATSCPNCFKPTSKINRKTTLCKSCGWSRTKEDLNKKKTNAAKKN